MRHHHVWPTYSDSFYHHEVEDEQSESLAVTTTISREPWIVRFFRAFLSSLRVW